MGSYLPGLNFPIYSGWTQYTPVIPKLYWNVYSAEQRLKQLCLNFDKVENYLDYISTLMNEWNIEFSEEMQKELAEIWEAVNNGLENAVHDWITENINNIFKNMVKQVYFGLTLDGYFVAYIPEGNAWEDVIFDTGQVYDADDYGRLELFYPTDDNSDVWQESPYKDNDKMWKDLMDILSEMDVTGVQDIMDRLDEDEQAIYGPILESEVNA